MKRKAILLAVTLSLPSASAMADVYVKVDANGNAIGGAIVCEQSVCGNPNSDVSKALLGENERFVLQGTGTVGIGNNNPGIELKHEATTNEWVMTNNNTPTPTVERFTTVEARQPVVQNPVPVSTPIVDTKTVIIADSSTTLVDTATARVDYSTIDWQTLDWATFNWEEFLTWLTAYIDQLLAVKP